jgi:hypothetical protein
MSQLLARCHCFWDVIHPIFGPSFSVFGASEEEQRDRRWETRPAARSLEEHSQTISEFSCPPYSGSAQNDKHFGGRVRACSVSDLAHLGPRCSSQTAIEGGRGEPRIERRGVMGAGRSVEGGGRQRGRRKQQGGRKTHSEARHVTQCMAMLRRKPLETTPAPIPTKGGHVIPSATLPVIPVIPVPR